MSHSRVAATFVAACLAVTLAMPAITEGRTLDAGWANCQPRAGAACSGGDSPSTSPTKEIWDDAHTRCASNSALLFRVRGSGAHYGEGADALGKWAKAAGDDLIRKGYNVRDMQARYNAPGVPYWEPVKALALRLLAGPVLGTLLATGPAKKIHKYRDTARTESPSVSGQLLRAFDRCPDRPILLAGYSLGGVVLRYVIPGLNGHNDLLDQIEQIDLIADPTADNRADKAMASGGPAPQRGTGSGADTAVGRSEHAHFFFKQTKYPNKLVGRTYQYCEPYDIVCDFNPLNVGSLLLAQEGRIHASYPWAKIGEFASSKLQALGPSCTAKALEAGLTRGDNPVPNGRVYKPWGCAGRFAYAAVDDEYDNTVTVLFKASGHRWQTADRGKYCSSGEVPAQIYFDACQTN